MMPDNLNLTKVSKHFKKVLNPKKIIPEFARKTAFQRWAIAIFLSAILSLLLTPQVYFSYPEYKVGSIATRDVRADHDFLVEDKADTEQKKAEVIKDVQSVYDYDGDIASQIKLTVAKGFSFAEQLLIVNSNEPVPTQTSLNKGRNDFEKLLGIALSNDELNILQKYKFSNLISESISKIIAGIYKAELITNTTFTKQDTENGIIIRDIRTQKVKIERKLNTIKYVKNIDTTISKKANDILKDNNEDLRKTVISISKKLIQPNLKFNKNASERQKQTLLADFKPVFFQVLKDEMIIREGQKISPSDLDKLNAFFKIKGEKNISNIYILLGTFFLILSLSIVLFQLSKMWIQSDENISDIIFMGITTLFQILLIKSGIFMSEAVNRAFPFFSTEACYFAIPFATGAMLVGIFINRSVALIFSIYSSFLATFLFEGEISMMLFAFIGSVVASYHVSHCKQRSAFFKIGLLLGLLNGATILSLCLFSPSTSIISSSTITKLSMGIVGGIVSGILVAAITPIFEALFNYTTDIKLLELANLNHPIFQRMIMEAPGTYHHSIIVASLVEAAAEAIGANPLLAKVSAYYHDIGKIKKPQYFIENQQNGENKHVKLSPKMSSLIITTHVKEGCELASKAKLGTRITNIIREHHGTSLVSYFYEKSKKDRDPSIRSLLESDFRYAGPKPQSKEAGLVLLGDVIEASSRTLSNPTPARIKNLVRERIERVFMDGQLDDCELTLHDLNKIAENFMRILNGIFHQRIDYPDLVIREFNGNKKGNNVDTYRKQAEKNKH
ncbi:MAG TPA: HDIG domain-containing protein [Syntrophales bacterium]|nr:HDIG domain-containing protein [Syntrophales bacterium]